MLSHINIKQLKFTNPDTSLVYTNLHVNLKTDNTNHHSILELILELTGDLLMYASPIVCTLYVVRETVRHAECEAFPVKLIGST